MDRIDEGLVRENRIGKKVSLVLWPVGQTGVEGPEEWKSCRGQVFELSPVLGRFQDDNVTVYDWEVSRLDEDGKVFLSQGDQGEVFMNRVLRADSFSRMFSVCSGMGGSLMGFAAAGFECVGAIDRSPLAVRSLRQNFDFPIIEGDLCSDKVKSQIHRIIGPEGCWFEGGFPCQPFSRLGDGRGLSDCRSSTLVHIFRLAWLTQAHGLCLECVEGAGQDGDVAELLAQFESLMSMQHKTKVLHLQRCWASRRSRWWVVIFPVSWGTCPDLGDLPLFPQWQAVRDVIPLWPHWTEEAIDQLKWTAEECGVYRDAQYGPVDRRLDLTKAAPTLLHSAGSHLTGCACGCRAFPFRLERLRAGGIHLIEIHDEKAHCSRHLHPQEAGLLQGVSVKYKYVDDLRGALGLVGQIASPFQAEWVGLFVRQLLECSGVDNALPPLPHEVKDVILLWHGEDLLHERLDSWTTSACFESGRCVFRAEDGSHFECVIQSATPVREFVDAQTRLQREPVGRIFRGAHELSDEAFLLPGTYSIMKSQLGCPAAHSFEVDLIVEDQVHRFLGWTGDFLFQFVHRLDLDWAGFGIYDEQGAPQKLDTVLSQSCRFEVRPLQHGTGLQTEAVLKQVIHAAPLQATLLQRQAFGNAPPLDEGLDDVVVFHAAKELVATAQISNLLWISPRTVTKWLAADATEVYALIQEALAHFDGDRIVAIFGDDSHWAVLDYQALDCGAEIAYVDGIPDRLLEQATRVGQLIHDVFGCGPLAVTQASCYCQDGGNACGAVAVLHFGWRLGLWSNFTKIDVQLWYKALRWGLETPVFFGGGDQDALVQRLGEILVQKGVAESAVSDRIAQAQRTFGKHKLEQALQAQNPWAALKALGSSRPKPFLWVSYNELQDHIRLQGQAKFGAGLDIRKKSGTPKTKPQPPRYENLLDPGKLQLLPKHFGNGLEEIPQLAFAQVANGACGVAFCRPTDALPFLEGSESWSLDALMILVVGTVDVATSRRTHEIVVPAMYQGTGEPILVSCIAIQLGDVDAVEMSDQAKVEVQSVPFCVIRIHWFRDECELPWDEVCRRPVKHLVELQPKLQLCRDRKCGGDDTCGFFHPTVEEAGIESALLDLWSWRWSKFDGTKCKQREADVFQVFARCPESLLEVLQPQSGHHGVYFEPRKSTGLGPHDGFAIIWLSQSNLASVLHLQKAEAKVVGIARLGLRYGIRCAEQHEADLHLKYCPNKPYVKGKISLKYRLEPVPPGTQKQALAEALQKFGWQAKPLQPIRGGQGKAWEIGAAEPPPTEVIRLTTGYATITKLKEVSPTPAHSFVVSSARTRDHIRKEADAQGSDPWEKGEDPWAVYRATKPGGDSAPAKAIPAGSAQTRLEEVEKKIQEEVQTKIQTQFETLTKDLSQRSSNDGRIDRLECELGELKKQGQRFEHMFEESRIVSELQQQAIAEVKTSLGEQAQHLQHTQVGLHQLSADVQGFQAGIDQRLESLFARQTAQISEMLVPTVDGEVKRARRDQQ